MRKNGCDSTLPGSTRCSLILLIETHATTTNIMRNIEYITNGFGGPSQIMPPPAYIPPGGIQSGGGGGNFPAGFFDPRYTTQGPSDSQIFLKQAAAFGKAGLSEFLEAGTKTLGTRGIAGIDQAINFFSRYDQSLQALSQMITQNNQTFGGRRGGEYVYEAVRRVFNAISSQVGTNPLISAMTKSFLSRIDKAQGQEYKFLLAYIGEAYTQALKQVRNSL